MGKRLYFREKHLSGKQIIEVQLNEDGTHYRDRYISSNVYDTRKPDPGGWYYSGAQQDAYTLERLSDTYRFERIPCRNRAMKVIGCAKWPADTDSIRHDYKAPQA